MKEKRRKERKKEGTKERRKERKKEVNNDLNDAGCGLLHFRFRTQDVLGARILSHRLYHTQRCS